MFCGIDDIKEDGGGDGDEKGEGCDGGEGGWEIEG